MAHAFHFGAQGDGQTDDGPALQHALEQGDGVLQLHKGTFRITRPLVLDLQKQGYGAVLGLGGTSRIVMAGPGPALRIVGNHGGTAVPGSVLPATWDRERFPVVRGIEILGEHPEAVGIALRGTMQPTISEVLIRRCRYGLHLVERNRNVIVSHCHIYDNHEYGVFFDRCNLHQTIIQGSHISYNKRAGIRAHDGDVHNLQITGCDIEYNNQPKTAGVADNGAEIWFDAPTGIISEVTIASNTIQATREPGGTNIRIHGGPNRDRRGACLITIAGNIIGSQTRGIELRHAMRIGISGNTLYDATDLNLHAHDCAGVALSGNTTCWMADDALPPRDGLVFEDCDHCTVTGLSAARLSFGAAEQGAGLTFVRCRDCAVTGSQLIDPWVRGVELIDCIRCRISDNSIVDRREPPRMAQAIRIRGGRGNVVQHNLVAGATGTAIDVEEGAATVVGNHA